MVRGVRKDGQKKKPAEQVAKKSPGSATCTACGVSAPARADNGLPMIHYDGRIENAHVTQTYCSGE